MAGIGTNGTITTFPQNGEKICVGCEHWTGGRELTYNGNAATSLSARASLCEIKRAEVLPQQPCSCSTNKFEKWHLIR